MERSVGVLLHISSLPNKYGIGTLGREAYECVDFLKANNQKLWQICPIGPTGYGDSPYQCFSAFAGNPYFIDLDMLLELQLIDERNLPRICEINSEIDYSKLYVERFELFRIAYINYKNKSDFKYNQEYNKFKLNNKDWLSEFALFMALKKHYNGKSWVDWDEKIKLRLKEEITKYEEKLFDEIEYNKFMQFLFFYSWDKLKKYANENNIEIIGDMPIYIALDSVDAWVNNELFLFDKNKNPLKIAGVPPDYFSKTGQLWGNPVYDWKKLEKTNFKWWVKRVKESLKLFDYIRIDHFRGFSKFWAVEYGAKTAECGKWLPAKGNELFKELKKQLGNLPIIAEDLGTLTDDVIKLRDDFNFPGMRILQFAFDSEETATNFLPHSYNQNTIVYTGTHDNQTVAGWYKSASNANKDFVRKYFACNGENIVYDFIRAAYASTAVWAILPMQDILQIDDEGRMNTPAVAEGNWKWRFKFEDISNEMKSFIVEISSLYSRI